MCIRDRLPSVRAPFATEPLAHVRPLSSGISSRLIPSRLRFCQATHSMSAATISATSSLKLILGRLRRVARKQTDLRGVHEAGILPDKLPTTEIDLGKGGLCELA